jgi:hypothetical protein
MSNAIGKFLIKAVEATAVHLVAAGAAKGLERGLEKGFAAAAEKMKRRRTSKTEPSTKTDEDFEGLK